MLRLAVLLLGCAAVASAAEPACDCAKDAGKSTLELLTSALGEKGGLMKRWGDVCQKEKSETDDWLKTIEGNSADNKADFEARQADKKGLAGALESRIAGLKAFIAQLKDILNKMGYHIDRTNKLYSAKYDANLQDQTSASLTLHDLSLDFAAPHNVKLNPIQQVKDWSAGDESAPTPGADAAAAAPEPAAADAEAKTEAAMMLLETRVQHQMRICHGTGCQGAYQKAFHLYQESYKRQKINKANFDSEKKTLGMFRKKTREMLDKKKAKLAKLQKQLADINAALANPDGDLSDLFPLIQEHSKVFTESCTQFGKSSTDGKNALEALRDAIKAKQSAVDAENAKSSDDKMGGDAPAAPAEPVADTSATTAAPKAGADADLTQILNQPVATANKNASKTF